MCEPQERSYRDTEIRPLTFLFSVFTCVQYVHEVHWSLHRNILNS